MVGQSEFGKIIKLFINLAFNEASGLIPRHLERVPIVSQRSCAASSYRQFKGDKDTSTTRHLVRPLTAHRDKTQMHLSTAVT